METQNNQLGYLRSCMDRRFLADVRKAFEKATGLGPTDYWHESYPGGSALPIDETGEKYAREHGVTIWGWAAHGSTCGGQPGVSDEDIVKRLAQVVKEKKEKYPGDHYTIFSTESGTTIGKIE